MDQWDSASLQTDAAHEARETLLQKRAVQLGRSMHRNARDSLAAPCMRYKGAKEGKRARRQEGKENKFVSNLFFEPCKVILRETAGSAAKAFTWQFPHAWTCCACCAIQSCVPVQFGACWNLLCAHLGSFLMRKKAACKLRSQRDADVLQMKLQMFNVLETAER